MNNHCPESPLAYKLVPTEVWYVEVWYVEVEEHCQLTTVVKILTRWQSKIINVEEEDEGDDGADFQT